MSLIGKQARIWIEGETTNGFVCPEVSFSKSKRFKLHSIYWPDKSAVRILTKTSRSSADEQAHKISKNIDEQQKNESRMNKTEMGNKKKEEKNDSLNKNNHVPLKLNMARTMSLSLQDQKIVQRLTHTSGFKQSKLRDRHGNRTNLYENQEDQLFEKIKQDDQLRCTEKGFYTSRRINLNLPHNYYPGPGTYNIQRYLEQKPKKMQFIKNNTLEKAKMHNN